MFSGAHGKPDRQKKCQTGHILYSRIHTDCCSYWYTRRIYLKQGRATTQIGAGPRVLGLPVMLFGSLCGIRWYCACAPCRNQWPNRKTLPKSKLIRTICIWAVGGVFLPSAVVVTSLIIDVLYFDVPHWTQTTTSKASSNFYCNYDTTYIFSSHSLKRKQSNGWSQVPRWNPARRRFTQLVEEFWHFFSKIEHNVRCSLEIWTECMYFIVFEVEEGLLATFWTHYVEFGQSC